MSQSKENSSLFSNSLRIFAIRFSGTLASLLIMILFSHKLESESYGNYQNFWVQLTLLSSIAGLGLGLLIFTYPPAVLQQLIRRLKPVHYTTYAAVLLATALLFTFLRYPQLADWWRKGYLSFLFFISYTLSILLEAIVIVLRHHKLLIRVNLAYALAFTGVGVLTWRQGYSLEMFVACLLPFTLLRLLFLLYPFLSFVRSRHTGDEAVDFRSREVTSLWLHLGVYDLLSVTILWIDKFAVSLLASAATAAIYFNGSFNIPFIPLALTAVGNATLMQLHAASTKRDKALLMQQAGRMLSCVVYPIFAFLLIYSQEFVTVVFSSKYSSSVPIFICSLLILPVRAYSNTTILQNLHRGRLINIGLLLDFIVALALMAPLYYFMDLAGVALSFVISTYAQAAFYLYHSTRLLGVPVKDMIPLKNWLFKALFFTALALLLHLSLAGMKPIFSLGIAAGVIGIAALALLRWEMKTADRHQ